MSYRPITDIWFLARAKLKPKADGSKNTYYGAYLGGFPERARVLLGASIDEPVLHVCGGMARYYPYKGGFGERDQTLDLDPKTEPNFELDANEGPYPKGFRAMLADPPYSETDAAHYVPGAEKYPSPSRIMQHMIDALPRGGRAGIIHYMLPRSPKNAKFVACVGVVCGFNNRMRCFSVFERIA